MQYPGLQVAVNLDTRVLDLCVFRWAFSKKIIQSYEELDCYRLQKVNFFAGYLFPHASRVELEWIMKVFLWLFVLDDRLDSEQVGDSKRFIWALLSDRDPAYASPFLHLFQSWKELQTSFPRTGKTKWLGDWDRHWSTFLNGLQWELNNKCSGTIPQLSEYRYHRPHLSGVYLALHYLKLEEEFIESGASNLLEHQIARWICLGNDLTSAGKEEALGDFHNELFLLSQIVSKREAKASLENEIQTLYRHIQKLQAELLVASPECSDWISRLNLLMGGCVYWSSDVTVRYESYLNGVAKT